ncbi:MAG TPA: radical SAM protein [Methanomassiliicoccales archaeon]|nr:radical SAM protein [Methanomassiliicoccales archaeon]
MKIISLVKNGDMASLSLSGCPMKCGYCAHVRQDRKDMTLEKVIADLSSPILKRVYVGGMEPAIQRKEVRPLLQALKSRGLDVALKTSGYDPEFLEETLKNVDRYVFEIKAPLDDIEGWMSLGGHDREWTVRYLENLRKSLEVVHGRPVKIVTRAIPGHIDAEKIDRIGIQLQPYAREASLTQFLGNLMNDVPYFGITEASPSDAEMMALGIIMVKHFPMVRVSGSGFDTVVKH